MKNQVIENLISVYGDRWVLRDLDFFPEKLSNVCRLYPYTVDTYKEVINGRFVSFKNEKDALEACIKIYKKVLNKEVPKSIIDKYITKICNS